MEKHYDYRQASAAQEAYCEMNELPRFAPGNGVCFYCYNNIYLPERASNGIIYGISVEEAGARLITGCPHCGRSFCE